MYYDVKESGKRIKELREAKKLSQSELAEKLNIHPKTIGKAERGETGLSVDNLMLIADFFGTTVDYLVRGTVLKDVSGKLYDLIRSMNLEQQEAAFGIMESILKFPA